MTTSMATIANRTRNIHTSSVRTLHARFTKEDAQMGRVGRATRNGEDDVIIGGKVTIQKTEQKEGIEKGKIERIYKKA